MNQLFGLQHRRDMAVPKRHRDSDGNDHHDGSFFA